MQFPKQIQFRSRFIHPLASNSFLRLKNSIFNIIFRQTSFEISILKNRGTPRTTPLAREPTSDRKSRNLVSRARDHFDWRASAVATSRGALNAFLGSVPTSLPDDVRSTCRRNIDPVRLVNSWPNFHRRRREKCSIVPPEFIIRGQRY